MSPDVPARPSAPAPTNSEDPPGVQPSTTKASKLDLEGEGMGHFSDMGNPVDCTQRRSM